MTLIVFHYFSQVSLSSFELKTKFKKKKVMHEEDKDVDGPPPSREMDPIIFKSSFSSFLVKVIRHITMYIF